LFRSEQFGARDGLASSGVFFRISPFFSGPLLEFFLNGVNKPALTVPLQTRCLKSPLSLFRVLSPRSSPGFFFFLDLPAMFFLSLPGCPFGPVPDAKKVIRYQRGLSHSAPVLLLLLTMVFFFFSHFLLPPT